MTTDFGLRLKAAREHAKLTQDQLALKAEMAQSTLASAERTGYGSRKTAQLAAACGVNAHWLATGEGEMLTPPITGQGHATLGAVTGTATGTVHPLGAGVAQGPTLDQALPVVLDALAAIPALRWPAVQATLAQMVGHPEMRDDLAPELLGLLRPAASPAKRHGT